MSVVGLILEMTQPPDSVQRQSNHNENPPRGTSPLPPFETLGSANRVTLHAPDLPSFGTRAESGAARSSERRGGSQHDFRLRERSSSPCLDDIVTRAERTRW